VELAAVNLAAIDVKAVILMILVLLVAGGFFGYLYISEARIRRGLKRSLKHRREEEEARNQ
jgi:hypothetical protein